MAEEHPAGQSIVVRDASGKVTYSSAVLGAQIVDWKKEFGENRTMELYVPPQPRRRTGLYLLIGAFGLAAGGSLQYLDHLARGPVAPAAALAQVRNTIFEDQEVRLDGQAFHNCTFKNVTMIYNGGPYELDGSTFSGTLRFGTYSVPVSNSMNLLRELGAYQESFGKAMQFTTPKVLRSAP